MYIHTNNIARNKKNYFKKIARKPKTHAGVNEAIDWQKSLLQISDFQSLILIKLALIFQRISQAEQHSGTDGNRMVRIPSHLLISRCDQYQTKINETKIARSGKLKYWKMTGRIEYFKFVYYIQKNTKKCETWNYLDAYIYITNENVTFDQLIRSIFTYFHFNYS